MKDEPMCGSCGDALEMIECDQCGDRGVEFESLAGEMQLCDACGGNAGNYYCPFCEAQEDE